MQKGVSDMALMRKIGNGAGAGLNAAQVAFLKNEDLPDGQPYDIELEHEALTRSWVSDQAPFRDHPSPRQLWTHHAAAYPADPINTYPATPPAASRPFDT